MESDIQTETEWEFDISKQRWKLRVDIGYRDTKMYTYFLDGPRASEMNFIDNQPAT